MANSDEFYRELRNEVTALLVEFGTTFTIKTPGIYRATELDVNGETSRPVTGLIADQQFSKEIKVSYKLDWVGSNILLLTADAFPKLNETILVHGKRLSLSKITTLQPANVILAYVLDLQV